MKKNLLFLAAFFLIGSFVFAQKTHEVKSVIIKKKTKDVLRSTTPFWTDDFSDANTWDISNGSGNTDNWVIGTEGPAGTYKIDPIASTTHDNGFALFDSDKMCSGKQDGYLTTKNPIDCSTHANVVLSFESYYRRYKDTIYVEVSTDATNWTQFELHGDYQANDTDPTNPMQESFLISSVADGQSTVYIRFRFKSLTDGCGYSWQVDDIQLSELPSTELSVEKVNMPSVAVAGERSIAFTVRNNGVDTVKNFNVKYIIDDTDTSIVDSLKNLAIAFNEKLSLTHKIDYDFTDAKEYKVKVLISNVNADADEKAENNTDSTKFQVVFSYIQKKALHEVLTASTCPPCATANPVLDGVVYNNNEDKATLVKYQVNWPGSGDPYYDATTAGVRVSYYSVTGVPTFKINGINTEDGATYTQVKLNNYTTETANSEITGTASITGTKISLNVDFTSRTQIKGTQLKARFAVIETKTTDNKGTNGEKEFHHVVMSMLPDAEGYALSSFISNGQIQKVQLNKDLKNTFIEGCTDLQLVAWLQDDSTKEVYQSAYIPITFNRSTMDSAIALFDTVSITENSKVLFDNKSSNAEAYMGVPKYKWIFGDGKRSTEENPTHTYRTNRTYKVTLYAHNFCRDTATMNVTITKVGVGINSINQKEIAIYPNPSAGVVYIDNIKDAEVVVYNTTGVIVQQTKAFNETQRIDLSAQAKGTYVIKIILNDHVYTHKIILVK